jgi:hypothetical protein
MVRDLFFSPLVPVALVWLCLMLYWVWPSGPAPACPTPSEPTPSLPKCKHEPQPFAGLTTKAHCEACAPGSDPRPPAPVVPPPHIVTTRGRRRQVDTAHHFWFCRKFHFEWLCAMFFLSTINNPA